MRPAGLVSNPYFPSCYCSPPDSQGQVACFDFDGATSTLNCNPDLYCFIRTAQPGEYSIQLGGPIYQVGTKQTLCIAKAAQHDGLACSTYSCSCTYRKAAAEKL